MSTANNIISQQELLDHWQGHRRLTRKVIEAFPEDQLFSFSIGGMRTFADLTLEMLDMAEPGVSGIATGKWIPASEMSHIAQTGKPTTKQQLLDQWDAATIAINKIWPTITRERFLETDTAFGQWPGTIISFVFYFIDNEIHHRGQGTVYLRSLGIEPPAFWDRQ